MVGLDSGLASKQEKATATMDMSLSWMSREGVASRGSNISWRAKFTLEDNDGNEERKSLGWSPLIISSVKTLKL